MCRGVVIPDKALSFHARAVSCFNKGKAAHALGVGAPFSSVVWAGMSSWSVPVRRSGWKTKPPYARWSKNIRGFLARHVAVVGDGSGRRQSDQEQRSAHFRRHAP